MRALGRSIPAAIGCMVLAIAAAPTVAAACALAVTDVTSTTWTGRHGRGYDVFDAQRSSLAVTFRVRGRDGACPFFVTVAPTATSDGTTGQLHGSSSPLLYELHKDAGGSRPLKPLELAGISEVFSDAAAGDGGSTAFQFAILVPPQQVVAPGSYSGDLEIAAYEGQLGNGILRDRRRLPVAVPVPSVAELSFAEGAGFDPNYGSHTVDFNDLRPGKRRVVSLKARSNSGYRVSLESLNGALRHVDASDDSEVPYALTVDGTPVTLPRGIPAPAVLHAQATGPGGQQHVLEFTVGAVGTASPGNYRDVVSLTVVSLR